MESSYGYQSLYNAQISSPADEPDMHRLHSSNSQQRPGFASPPRPRPSSSTGGTPKPAPAPTEGAQMQQRLDKVTHSRQKYLAQSPYKHVEVLLLEWENGDLPVRAEVDSLEKVFSVDYKYTTRRYSIPSIRSEDQLIHHVLEFRRGLDKGDLIIVYYGGHAGGTRQECIWHANILQNSPSLNWHNVQNLLLGCQADVLLVLDCCFAELAVRNSGIGDNWFMGASSKTSVAAGVSPFSFTRTLTRELKRSADLYWENGNAFTVASIDHAFSVHERDLRFSPKLTRLTDHECPPTELTPLSYPRVRPKLQGCNSLPEGQVSSQTASFPLSIRPKTSYTLPPTASSNHNARPDSSDSPLQQGQLIQSADDAIQTLRITGLPLPTSRFDIVEWFERRLSRGSVVSRIGPIVESLLDENTKEAVVTFPSVALARQAAAIRDLEFTARKGFTHRPPYKSGYIAIDDRFNDLACIYQSIKAPDRQPSVDIVLVHGAYGHAINSFACHYVDPSNEFLWPRDALAKALEGAGIYPRILTFGWAAAAWLNPDDSIPNTYDNLVQLLGRRSPKSQRPLFFIAHGTGGFLVKQAVNEIINYGFNFQHFENPVKACFFFAVPNRSSDDEDDEFASMLANMKSAIRLSSGAPQSPSDDHTSRNIAIQSLSDEFDTIRNDYDIECLTFNGNKATAGVTIVPPLQSTLDGDPDKAFHFDHVDYHGVARLSRTGYELGDVVNALSASISEKLGLSTRPQNEGLPSPGRSTTFQERPPDKEKVYAMLKRYDTAFLVDDSGSMFGRKWGIAKSVLAQIASIAVTYDSDGVDVRFFNAYSEDSQRLGLDSPEKVMHLFESVTPEGPTPTADMLEIELNDYCVKYKNDRRTKPLNLIVVTDGEPEDGQDVEGVIVKYARRLAVLEAPPLQVGIQFVQIGEDKATSEFLRSMDDDLKVKHGLDRDMVDTVPWVARDEARLCEKILLGGILKRLDNDQR